MRRGGVIALPTAATAIAHALPAAAKPVPRIQGLFGISAATGDGRDVALTFDDGPHPDGTIAVLDALAARGATATFFLVGEQVDRFRRSRAEIVAAGHRIGVHGDRHRNLLRLTPRQARLDLDRGFARIVETVGVGADALPPAVRRPQRSGAASRAATRLADAAVVAVGTGLGVRSDADIDRPSASLRDVKHGSVLLLHDADHYSAPDSWRATAAAIPRVLERLAALGLRAVVA